MGKKFVTFVTNVRYNCWLSDVMTGRKAMRAELFRSLELRERRAAIESEIADRADERGHASTKCRSRTACGRARKARSSPPSTLCPSCGCSSVAASASGFRQEASD
jgi:hypothetical protein